MKKNLYYLFVIISILSSFLSAQGAHDAEDYVITSDSLINNKRRWINDSHRIESLLKENATYLQSLKDKDTSPDTRWLDETDALIKQYESEDKTNPAIDSIMQEFSMTYRFYSQEAQQQRKKMEQYGRDIHFAVSLGGGGFFAFKEPGPLFYSNTPLSALHLPQTYSGFSVNCAYVLFLKENISVEFNYTHATSYISPVEDFLRLTHSPYSTSQINADAYNINTSSIDLIGSYYIEITPGFKSVLGLGVILIQNDASVYNSRSEGVVVYAFPYSSDFVGTLIRIGFEFSLNSKRTFTLQTLCDGRIPISSPSQDSPNSLQPYLRFVWHL